MPHVTDPQCPECKQSVKVYVREERMISSPNRFRYDCPACGQKIEDEFKVFEYVTDVPEGAAIAERLGTEGLPN